MNINNRDVVMEAYDKEKFYWLYEDLFSIWINIVKERPADKGGWEKYNDPNKLGPFIKLEW